MVAAKGKLSVAITQVAEDAHSCRTGLKTFKIYSENEKKASSIKSPKVSVVTARRISVQVNKEDILAPTSDLKECPKIVGKIKGKHENSRSSVNQNVRRKALADVSNVRSIFARNVTYDGSKPLISVGPGLRNTDVSLRKSAVGKMKANSSEKASNFHSTWKGAKDLRSLDDQKTKTKTKNHGNDFHSTRKVGAKDLRGSLDDQKTKTKNHGHEFVIDNRRRNSRNSFVAIRRSLPVLKKVSQGYASVAKENDESSEKARRISGFPVKMKKTVPQGSMHRNHLRRNRASDGFIVTAPKVQTNVDARVSKKSFRPIVKTKINTSSLYKTSRSKCISNMNKSKSIAAVSLKKKAAVESSCPENVLVAVANEVTQGEPSSNSNNKTGFNNIPDVIPKIKSSRRRSYTALLMARSKLLDEHGEVIEQKKLPNIDDTFNQLEVAEYVDEIYEYYWVSEMQKPSLENYMSIQTEITPQMRGIVINWLIEVHFKFELMPETLYLMVTLLDRYLSQVQIKKNELQLIGLTALFLASKYEDFWHPRIKDLISISAESYTRGQMLLMFLIEDISVVDMKTLVLRFLCTLRFDEWCLVAVGELLVLEHNISRQEKHFVKKLKFRLNDPTAYVFMLRFLKAAESDLKLEHLAFYLIELCLVEYEALKFKPSMLCASAIYVARSTLQIAPAWTPLLSRHARYQVSQIRDCADMILRFQKAARTSQLTVTCEKYMRSDLSGVAAIEPLAELPL